MPSKPHAMGVLGGGGNHDESNDNDNDWNGDEDGDHDGGSRPRVDPNTGQMIYLSQGEEDDEEGEENDRRERRKGRGGNGREEKAKDKDKGKKRGRTSLTTNDEKAEEKDGMGAPPEERNNDIEQSSSSSSSSSSVAQVDNDEEYIVDSPCKDFNASLIYESNPSRARQHGYGELADVLEVRSQLVNLSVTWSVSSLVSLDHDDSPIHPNTNKQPINQTDHQIRRRRECGSRRKQAEKQPPRTTYPFRSRHHHRH